MTARWDLWIPSAATSNWPQQYQLIGKSAKISTNKFSENLASSASGPDIQRKECDGTIVTDNDRTNNNAFGYKINIIHDKRMRGDTAYLTGINRKNHLWLGFEQYHDHVNCKNNTNSPNNIRRSSLPIASAKGISDTPPAVASSLATSADTFDADQPTENNLLADQPRPVSDFLAEKPTGFNAFIERPKNHLHEKVSNLLDLMANIKPYSWQTESPLADRSDKYLNREVHDHFMQYDLKKNHCKTCGFQTELEQF